MRTTGDALAELRRTARAVLGRVDELEGRWRRGALGTAEVDELTRAVWLLKVDVELHASAADPSSPTDVAVLATIREGIDASIAIVAGLLEPLPPGRRRR